MSTNRTPLRAVGPDEQSSKPKPTTVAEASEQNDRLAELQLMRVVLAKSLDDPKTPRREISPIARQLIAIGREVEAMMATAEQEASEHAVVGDEAWDETAI